MLLRGGRKIPNLGSGSGSRSRSTSDRAACFFLLRQEGRLGHPLPETRTNFDRPRRRPPWHHRRPTEQPEGHRLYPHPGGGQRGTYQQKMTGKARRGSQRTPLRPGGGVIFGPKPKDWSIKINRKEKRLALSTAIASASATDDAMVVEDFHGEFATGPPRTKDFIEAMRRWGLDPKEKSMFLMTELSDNIRLSCRNIGTVKLLTPRTLNLFDVLDSGKLIFTRSALDYLNSMYGDDEDEQDEDDLLQVL